MLLDLKLLRYLTPGTEEVSWQKYIFNSTPMGLLTVENDMFSSFRHASTKGITLIHATPRLDEITKTGILFSSGGCLGASPYCTPLRLDGRLHNLAEFMIKSEIPGALRSKKIDDRHVDILGIHLYPENFSSVNTMHSGMDYLCLGRTYLELFKIITPILKKNKQDLILTKNITQQIASVSNLFRLSYQNKLEMLGNLEFEEIIFTAITKMPLLGYVLFEILLEYVLLFQNDKLALAYRDQQKEFYNWHHKKMVFDLCPNLLGDFNLSISMSHYRNL